MNDFLFRAERELRTHGSEESCSRPTALPDGPVPAMAYIPLQFYDELFELEEGFRCGTVFPELSKPFTGGDPR